MKIIKCQRCGKYVHEASNCYHCGNAVDFEEMPEPNIHNNVCSEYSKMLVALRDKNYSEVLALSQIVIEWMPTCADVFWMRVLAKNKCSNDLELLQKGIDYEENPDFYNAIIWSTGFEREVYQDVKDAIEKIEKELKDAVVTREYERKKSTDLLRVRSKVEAEIEIWTDTVFKLWSDLEKTEQNIHQLEMDYKLIAHEHKTMIDKTEKDVGVVILETCEKNECWEEESHFYQVELGKLLQQSQQAKQEGLNEQHIFKSKLDELLSKRDKQVFQIEKELSRVRSYEDKLGEAISEIEEIEIQYKEAKKCLEEYDFQAMRSILGERIFSDVLGKCSILINLTYRCSESSAISSSPVIEKDNSENRTTDENFYEDFYEELLDDYAEERMVEKGGV